MNKQKMVTNFHKKLGLTVNTKPTIPDINERVLRINLIREELTEFELASLYGDFVEVADAVADLLYVVYGAAVVYGLPADKLFKEVHKSNMTKVWPKGKVQKRADGKVLKPPTYVPPNIKKILMKSEDRGPCEDARDL